MIVLARVSIKFGGALIVYHLLVDVSSLFLIQPFSLYIAVLQNGEGKGKGKGRRDGRG